MTQIKKGDKLRVLSAPNTKLTVGEIVTAVSDQRDSYGDELVDIEKNGVTQGYKGFFASRFEVVQGAPTKKAEVDFTKPLQTRDGRTVTLISTQGRGKYPVMVYIGESDSVSEFTLDGSYWANGSEDAMDIINVPKKPIQVTKYFNLYADGTVGSKFDTLKDADAAACMASCERIGVKKVVFTEGEFDA